ncbi:ChbG/HpnK family deacetylase [Sporomusa malonica]|uniref:Hopanoid biosynthesis associated protein HpnK n=1 Tax=Sporomusa malonica TaxID=112901 RepID=A0A1W2E9X2_9FIRM|nr:ChbG/HpnK family deacetylase [Sporomusa malonica]SMD06232.1 hopanoid biosynthesis associated protein HpnK [Sporomusa malonica]
MKQLIINADDFGLHEKINLGIIEGYTNGCITSTTIMAGAPAFDHATALAADYRKLGIGVHLTLVGGYPTAEPEQISSLVDQEGMFCSKYPVFLRKFCSASVRLDDVRRELAAQVQKVLAAGIQVTHLDSHQHMHIVPGIIDVVVDIAREFNIPAIRIPAEPLLFFGGFIPSTGRVIGRSGLSILASLARLKARRARLAVTDHFYGMLAGGSMEELFLLNIINSLPNGTTEIMVHPGQDDTILTPVFPWDYHWQKELAAVTSPRVADCLKQRKIELVSFAGVNNR